VMWIALAIPCVSRSNSMPDCKVKKGYVSRINPRSGRRLSPVLNPSPNPPYALYFCPRESAPAAPRSWLTSACLLALVRARPRPPGPP